MSNTHPGLIRFYTVETETDICRFFATPGDSWRYKKLNDKTLVLGWVDVKLNKEDENRFKGLITDLHPTRTTPELIRYSMRRVIVELMNLHMEDM